MAEQIFEPPVTRVQRRRSRRNRLLLVVVAVVVVAATGFGVHVLLTSCGGLRSGVSMVDDQCIGVTDGSYVFDEAYRGIEEKIAAENQRVDEIVSDPQRKPDRAVTVALLDPMTVTDTSPLSVNEVRNRMEGAYTAQYRANHGRAFGNPDPLIRLVLANEGSHQQQWPQVVRQLVEMKDGDAPLTAVVGLGVSIDLTQHAAGELSRWEIPTVGAITTADQLNYASIPGFIRVSPSNRDYVASLRAYLARHPDLDSAILVYDSNSNSRGDIFVESLQADLMREMKDLLRFPAQSFVGRSIPSDTNPGLFDAITGNICAARPKVVFFAGRKIDLRGFLDSLGSRVCPDVPITLLTVDADPGVFDGDQQALRAQKITVAYADATDPRGWIENPQTAPEHFPEFLRAFQERGFGQPDLDDGGAISTHDAVAAAAKATRLAAVPSSPDPPRAPDALSQLLNLNTNSVVPGASGTLTFSNRGADSGNPVGKPVPVQQFPVPGVQATREETYYTR